MKKSNMNNPSLLSNAKNKDNKKLNNNGSEENTILRQLYISDTKKSEQFSHNSEHGFYIFQGMYFIVEYLKNKEKKIQISNFTMEVLFHLDDESNNTLRILYLQGKNGSKHLIEVKSEELKPERFETILNSKGFTFYGSRYNFKRILEFIMDREETAYITNKIGWSKEHKIYVFADAVFFENKIIKANDLGIIELDTNYKIYLPFASPINKNRDDWKDYQKFNFCEGDIGFSQWAELFFQAYNENASIGMLYAIASVFRDIIFNLLGFFPYEFLFGEYSTGKSKFAKMILAVFGKDYIGMSLNNASLVGLSRTVSQRTNSIFYYKEYTKDTDNQAQDFILNGYDGAGRTTGIKSNDNRTKKDDPESGIIFDGNFLPTQNSAILSRMLLLVFQTSRFSDTQTKAYYNLERLASKGFGKVLTEILSLRDKIEKQLPDTFEKTKSKIEHQIKSNEPISISEKPLPALDSRLLNHTALLLSTYIICKDNLVFPFTYDEFETILFKNMTEHNYLLGESKVSTIWWEAFAHFVKKGLIHSNLGNNIGHYNIKYNESDTCTLQIKLADIWTYYMRYCKENSITALDKGSIRMILTSESNKSFLPSSQKGRAKSYTDKEFGSCYQFIVNMESDPDSSNIRKSINGVELPI